MASSSSKFLLAARCQSTEAQPIVKSRRKVTSSFHCEGDHFAILRIILRPCGHFLCGLTHGLSFFDMLSSSNQRVFTLFKRLLDVIVERLLWIVVEQMGLVVSGRFFIVGI